MSYALFLLLGGVALAGALGVVTTRNVVHATLALLLTLMAVAGLFVLLLAPFLALVQVLIYGGAITIVILFALMLTRTTEFLRLGDNPQRPVAALAAVVTFGVLAAAFLVGRAEGRPRPGPTFEEFSTALFAQWALPFLVVSLVLLIALMGAIIIARSEERPEGEEAPEAERPPRERPAAPPVGAGRGRGEG